jgi:drug/metabolite transporter (DMT)-like permease
MVGVLLAFLSALVYGSADFFGGLATRRSNPYAVLTLAASVGILPMFFLAFINSESWPSIMDAVRGGFAGLMGFLGLVLLYYGLSIGRAAIVSSTAGIVSACLPVIYSSIFIAIPSPIQFIGFVIAILGIGLVSCHSPPEIKSKLDESETLSGNWNNQPAYKLARQSVRDILLGGISGIFFGLFFISLASISQEGLFIPLSISKFVAFSAGLTIILFSQMKLPSLRANPAIFWAGILDPAANALYLFATRFTRLDIAAVLASLYPAGTVLLSVIFLKEHLIPRQWAGFAFCLVAIALITS